MTYMFGDLGRCWSIFRDLGSKGKILLGSRGNYFQGSGEINALFSGIKGAQTPLGGSVQVESKHVLPLHWLHFIGFKQVALFDLAQVWVGRLPFFMSGSKP